MPNTFLNSQIPTDFSLPSKGYFKVSSQTILLRNFWFWDLKYDFIIYCNNKCFNISMWKARKIQWHGFQKVAKKNIILLYHPKLARFLKEDPPIIFVNEVDPKKRVALDAWNQSDFLCWNYIRNGLDNALYNMFYLAKEMS